MIEIRRGNMFDQPADYRVNLVNCVGTMGAGVAAQFAKKYPELLRDYRIACKCGKMLPGMIWPWEAEDGTLILNMATKDHWRNPSQFRWVQTGLIHLRNYLFDQPSKVCTLPAPGCGFGGLDWDDVKVECDKYLRDIQSTVYLYYNPIGAL